MIIFKKIDICACYSILNAVYYHPLKLNLPTLFLCALKGSMPGLLFVLAGMVVIYIMHGIHARRQHILDHGVRTEATVVDVNTRKSRRHTSHYPVLSFTDTRGCPQRIESRQDYYKKRGERVRICYLEENPLQLEILPPRQMTVLLLIICGGGIFCLGGGAMMIAGFRHQLKKTSRHNNALS